MIVAIVVLVVVASAAAGPAVERTHGDLRLRLATTKSTYLVGEPIEVRLAVTNSASAAVPLTWYTGQHSDLFVRQRGALIWQWSHDKAFTQAVRESTMAAGERVFYGWMWYQTDLQGRQVEPGAYEIWAEFKGSQRSGPRSVETGPLHITVSR
ncbi:MAG: BsuPI-related putative proteinase inhibitor [bacterium]